VTGAGGGATRRIGMVALAAVAAFVTGLVLFHLGMLAFVRTGSTLKVPDLVGLELDSARGRLDAIGFSGVVDREEHSADFGAGRVIGQRPGAGDVLRKGRKVWLTVSLGVRQTVVPSLVGQSLRQADIVLGREGFSKGVTTRLHHPQVPRGSVIAQDPPAGSAAVEGARVDFLVSLGPAPDAYVLPNLTRRPLGEVESLLASRGITVGSKTVLIDRSVLPSTVLEQDPPAGSRIEGGSEVDLVVSSRS
jgi:serine/threonine-protein kinase